MARNRAFGLDVNRPEAGEAGSGVSLFNPTPFSTAGGQGKLFGDEKPTAKNRYPRGYTPERMAQVRSAPIELTNETEFAPTREERQAAVHAPMTGHGAVREAQEAIARSSAPMEHFHGFSEAPLSSFGGSKGIKSTAAERRAVPTTPLEIHLNDNAHPEDAEDPNDAYGHFNAMPTAVQNFTKNYVGDLISRTSAKNNMLIPTERSRGRIGINNNTKNLQTADQILMHEIGHYKSIKVDKNPRPGKSGVKLAREEARADDYRSEHWRPDPRDVKRGNNATVPSYSSRSSYAPKEVNEPWTPHGKLRDGVEENNIPGQLGVSYYEHGQGWENRGGPKAHLEYLRSRTTPLVTDRRNEQAKAARVKNQDYYVPPPLPGFGNTKHGVVYPNYEPTRPAAKGGTNYSGTPVVHDAYEPLLKTTEKRHKKAEDRRAVVASNKKARQSRNVGSDLFKGLFG